MKLSLKKRFGWIQVTGGAVVRVAKEHAVTCDTLNEKDRHARKIEDKWVFAKVGDLAIEIVAVKTKKVLGHCYLSGTAVQLHRYTEAQSDWFIPASAKLFTFPHPHEMEAETEDECFDKLIEHAFTIKYAAEDVAAFCYTALSREDYEDAWESIATMFQLSKRGDERVQTAHIFGIVQGPKGKPMGTLHYEPGPNAPEHGASGFGIGLLLFSLGSPT